MRDVLSLPLPASGIDAIEALDEAAAVLESSMAQSRPRYLAYIGSSGLEIGALADLLAHSYDANLALDAGGATLVEAQALRWVGQFIGYPAAGGSFTSGGTVSNVTGLAAARESALPGSRSRGIDRPVAVYCSADAHYSVRRAVELLGIGGDRLRAVPVDELRRMRPDALADLIAADRRQGVLPIAVVGTAGTTLTGAVDPLDEIAEVSDGIWFHVDGAYGGPAASVRPELFEGIDRADSVSVDAHKWMFVPKACGVVMVRDQLALARAFGHETDYIPSDDLNAVDVTLEYSRPLRALKLWLALRVHGADEFRSAITRTISFAQLLHDLAAARPGWEVGPQPDLSIALIRHREVDNAQLVKEMQADGRVYLSHAVIDGETWLRPCFTNIRTSEADVRALMDVADEVARRLLD